jgi:hypothetical protein
MTDEWPDEWLLVSAAHADPGLSCGPLSRGLCRGTYTIQRPAITLPPTDSEVEP